MGEGEEVFGNKYKIIIKVKYTREDVKTNNLRYFE